MVSKSPRPNLKGRLGRVPVGEGPTEGGIPCSHRRAGLYIGARLVNVSESRHQW